MTRHAIFLPLLCIVLTSCNVEAVILQGELDTSHADTNNAVAQDLHDGVSALDDGQLTDPGQDPGQDPGFGTDSGPDQMTDIGPEIFDDGGAVLDSNISDVQDVEESPPEDLSATDTADTASPNDVPPDLPQDTGPVSTAWDPCESDDDCFEGPCVPTLEGKKCTVPCALGCPIGYACKALFLTELPPICASDTDCPQGYICFETDFGLLECVIPEGEELETEVYCLDTKVNLCKPCLTDSECQEYGGGAIDFCTELPPPYDPLGTESSYCLRNCGAANGESIPPICKNNTECVITDTDEFGGPVWRCVPIDGGCPCTYWAHESLGTSTCTLDGCPGIRSCDVDGNSQCEVCVNEIECMDGSCVDAVCVDTVSVGACNDGNACTTVDACSDGICFGTTPPDCDDGDPCTADACDPLVGCVNTFSEGSACDDGDPCTAGDTCTETGCIGTIAGSGYVSSEIKITEGLSGFQGPLKSLDNFGISCESLGDLDNDGSIEILVGAWDHDNGTSIDEGAVWMISVNSAGSVTSEHIVTEAQSGFSGSLEQDDLFGASISSLGDFGNNGTLDIVVGAPGDDYGSGTDVGAFWILELDPEGQGQVISIKRVGENTSGFADDEISAGDQFGSALAVIGDLDGNGYPDLAIGEPGDDAPNESGAIWIFFMTMDLEIGKPSILNYQKITPDTLESSDRFGSALAHLGDTNDDGMTELAVGVPGAGEGQVYILSLDSSGTVQSFQVIGEGFNNFTGDLGTADKFGSSLAAVGDIDGDGTVDLAVGASNDDGPANAYTNIGATWLLFMRPDGGVKGHHKITQNQGGFSGTLSSSSSFGSCATALGDLNQDGFIDLMIGAALGGIADRGEAWVLFLGNESCIDDPVAP